jgi:hypothetical protein
MVAPLDAMTLRQLAECRLQARQLLRLLDAACDDRDLYLMLPHHSATGKHLRLLRPDIPALITLLESLK